MPLKGQIKEMIVRNGVRNMVFIALLISILTTYFWRWASHIYIDISRSMAASNYPGDITFIDRVVYQLFFPASLFVVLYISLFLLALIFKNKIKELSPKSKFLFVIPLIFTVYISIDLYIFLFVN